MRSPSPSPFLVTFGKVGHSDSGCIWRLHRSQTHRAVTGMTQLTAAGQSRAAPNKCTPTCAPGTPTHLGGAVTEKTCQTPVNPTRASKTHWEPGCPSSAAHTVTCFSFYNYVLIILYAEIIITYLQPDSILIFVFRSLSMWPHTAISSPNYTLPIKTNLDFFSETQVCKVFLSNDLLKFRRYKQICWCKDAEQQLWI